MSAARTKSPVSKLEDDELWRSVSQLARQAYRLKAQLPEEQWNLRSKIENTSFDATNDIAEASGSLDPRDVKWSLGHARRDLFAFKNALSLALHTDQLAVEPELMVAIDDAVKLLDERVNQLAPAFAQWHKEMIMEHK